MSMKDVLKSGFSGDCAKGTCCSINDDDKIASAHVTSFVLSCTFTGSIASSSITADGLGKDLVDFGIGLLKLGLGASFNVPSPFFRCL